MTADDLDQDFQEDNADQTYQVRMLHCRACKTDEYFSPGERRRIDQVRNRLCDQCYSVRLQGQLRMDQARESLGLQPIPKPVHQQPWNALLA